MLSLVLIFFLHLGVNCYNTNLPEWKDLGCQPGHQYLFSDVTHNWEDSRGECELYGGWLVQINDRKEYNCLIAHGVKEDFNAWFWTDGNDMDNTGVWRHAMTPSLTVPKEVMLLN